MAPGGWAEVPNPLPYCRLLSLAVVSDDPAGMILRRRTVLRPGPGHPLVGEDPPGVMHKIDVDTTAVVDRAVDLEPGAAGACKVQKFRPGLIEVEVSAPRRQLLVVSESFDPGWSATAQGSPLPILRAYGDFMGCVVGPNTKNVVFRFTPASYVRGKQVSLFASLIALAWLGVLFFLPRRVVGWLQPRADKPKDEEIPTRCAV